ncbi:sensor histidine kinase [Lentzea sp. E54]|uniref:sensor histidine kinase n=1 Tax=Lentzea xerophila TaxID=3435883 RepID=UPI003DA492E1
MHVHERDRRGVDALRSYLAGVRAREGTWPEPLALAEVIGRALGASGCVLTLAGQRFAWGTDDGAWRDVPVEHDGVPQGVLAVSPESARPAGELAAVLAPVLAAVRLRLETEQLWRRGDAARRELGDRRWRAAAEMDRERRRLERDLHDGAQHHLVALRLSLALLEHAIATGDMESALRRLDDLENGFGDTERLMERTAAGVLPSALVTGGLASALTAELAHHDDVVLDVPQDLGRREPVVEAAIYFVCMEAVNNAHKHAPGALITVAIRDTGDATTFSVRDDGPGFDELPQDSGMHHLASRMAEAGGEVRIRAAPGQGTEVAGFVSRGAAG